MSANSFPTGDHPIEVVKLDVTTPKNDFEAENVVLREEDYRLRAEVAKLKAYLAFERTQNEGRLKALNEKSDECHREWTRAEKAEVERDNLKAEKAAKGGK